MGEEKVIISLLFVFGLIILIYKIYDSFKLNKEKLEKELIIKKEEQNKKQQKIKRQEESYRWNDLIQSIDDMNFVKDKYRTNKKIRVLIGDYCKYSVPFTNSGLKSMGIETEVVPTIADIIDRINSGNKYDVIITNNVYKNDESGEQLLSMLKKYKDFKTPIVILTVDNKKREHYISLGFDDYIEKPLNEEKIRSMFKKLIPDLKFTKIKKQ